MKDLKTYRAQIDEIDKKLIDLFGDKVANIIDTNDVNKAIQASYDLAKEGDSVILSPACASFDLFKNYMDRGDQFRKGVNTLTEKATASR